MNSTANKANISAIGPWLVVIAMGLDAKLGWGFEEAWYAAVASLLIWGATWAVPNAQPAAVNPNLKATVLLPLLILALLALQGCSLAPFGQQVEKAAVTVIDTAKEDRKAYNDQKADVLLTLPCDISVGAYYRIDNSVKQEALQMLCSGKKIGEPEANLGVGVFVPEPLPTP